MPTDVQREGVDGVAAFALKMYLARAMEMHSQVDTVPSSIGVEITRFSIID